MVERIDILFNASGNTSQLNAALSQLRAQMQAVANATQTAGIKNAEAYQKQIREVKSLRAEQMSILNSMGKYRTIQTQLIDPTDRLTQSIRKQEITFSRMGEVWKNSGAIAAQQLKQQRAALAGWYRDTRGRIQADFIIPNELPNRAGMLGMRMRVLSDAFNSASLNMVKWGKNTQWAGRQLTVGITLPLVLAGTAMYKLAAEVDEAMVRLTKVYDFAGDRNEQAMERVRNDTLKTAQTLAEQYGIMERETVEMAANFAQMGFAGQQLQGMTALSGRIMRIGDLEAEQSTNMIATMMNAFDMDVAEVTHTLDQFNQVENNTMLTMQDLADTIPKLSGALDALGFSAGQGAALLAQMRANGQSASEAANTLKFSLSRVFNPIEKSKADFDRVFGGKEGVLERLIEPDEGLPAAEQSLDVLTRLGEKLSELRPRERAGLLASLFETRRYAPMGKLLESLAEGGTKARAFQAAIETLGLSAEEAAEMTEDELDTMMQSMTGQIARLKASLASTFRGFGELILPPVVSFLEKLSGLTEWFDGLSDGTKRFVGNLGAIVAISGPIIMLLGLFGNFIGNFFRTLGFMSSRLLTLVGIKQQYTREESEALLATNNLTAALERQTNAYLGLATAAGRATAMREATDYAVQQTIAGAPAGSRVVGPLPGAINVPILDDRGRETGGYTMHNRSSPIEDNPQRIAFLAAQEEAAKKAAMQVQRLQRAMIGLGAAGMMTSLVADTNSWVYALGNALTMIGFIGPALMQLKVVQSMVGGVSGAFGKVGSKVALWGKNLATSVPMLGSIGAALPGIGIAVAAVAGGYLLWRNHMRKVVEEHKNAQEILTSMEELIGHTMENAEPGVANLTTGIQGLQNEADEWAAANEDAIKTMERMSDDQLRAYVGQMAVDIINTDGTADEAKRAIQIALNAVKRPTLNLDIDLDNIESIANETFNVFQSALYNAAEEGQRGTGFWESVGRFFTGTHQLSTVAVEDAKAWGQSLANSILSTDDIKVINRNFDNAQRAVEDNLESLESELANLSEEGQGYLRSLGVDPESARSVAEALREHRIELSNLSYGDDGGEADREIVGRISRAVEAERIAAQELVRRSGIDWTEEMAADINTINDAQAAILAGGNQIMQLDAQLTALQNRQSGFEGSTFVQGWEDMSEEMQLAETNAIRTSLGFDALTMAQFRNGEAAKANARRQRENAEALEEIQPYLDAARSAVEEQSQAISDAVLSAYDAQTEAGVESYESQLDSSENYYDRLERQSERHYDKALEDLEQNTKDRIENIEDETEARVEGLEAQIKKEEAIDARRQAIFEAEKARLAYLTEQSNTRLGIARAFAEGDVHEAAILRNNLHAQTLQYGMERDEALQGRGTAARVDRLQGRIDTIEERKDERIEAINEVADARRKDLEKERDQEQRRLERQRENAAEAIEIQRENYEELRAMQREETERSLELERQRMAAGKRAFEDHVDTVQGIAEDLGISIAELNEEYGGDTGQAWVTAIQTARRTILQDEGWANWGTRIINKVTDAGIGLNVREIMNFLKTGKLSDAQRRSVNQTTRENTGETRNLRARHSGGMAGYGDQRVAPARLKPDEVPAVLQRGEYVIDRKTVNRLGSGYFRNLQQSNMDVPKFHTGGLVMGMMTPGAAAGAAFGASALMGMFAQKAAEVGESQIVQQIQESGRMLPPIASAANELQAFMMAIRKLESGSPQGNYQADNGIGYYGAYQFGQALWNEWDKRTLGYDVALTSANKSEQDAVAAAAMQHYHDQYKDWGAVAAAWIGGPGGAADYLAGQTGASDAFGTSVASYAQRVLADMMKYMLEGQTGVTTSNLQPPDADATWRYPTWKYGLSPDVITAVASTLASIPGGQIITSAYRSQADQMQVNPAVPNSDHTRGKAVDIGILARAAGGTAASEAMGDQIAAAFRSLPNIKQVLWKTMTGGNHYNHVHAAFMHDGGLIPPLLRGGKVNFDNTLANLHRGETVLTAPLTRQLERGIDGGVTNQYNVSVTVGDNSNITERGLARELRTELQKISRETGGRRRKI